MNVSEAIANVLKQEGVEWAACFPSNNLIEAAAKEGIRTINFRHERGVGMAADGYSRMNNRQKFGVMIIQSQAGAENAMGALAQQYADNVPVLVLPGAPPLARLMVKPEFWPSRAYERFSKQVETIYTPSSVYDVLRRAFHALRNGRGGPVVVDTPSDVAVMQVPDDIAPYRSPQALHQAPEAGAIKDAVATLIRSPKPLIWSGMGVLFAGASPELTELAELLEIPVYCSMPGKSGIDERHPLALGAGSGSTTQAAFDWLTDSDTLLAVGTSLTTTGYAQRIPPGKFIIHNTITQEDINKDQYADIGLVGDAKLTLAAMVEEVKAQLGPNGRRGHGSVRDEIARIKAQWYEEWMPTLTDDSEPITPYRIIWELDQNLDKDNSIVTHDAGAPRDMIMPFYTAGAPHSYVGWGKSTHLGYGIPLMIGAKMAYPDRFCVNFMGDGAFGMSGLDIETSVRAGLPITTIVLNNGIMATYPGGYPVAKERFGTTFMQGDYAMIAEGLGAVGIKVEKAAEIAPAIKRAQELNAQGRTVLIDVKTRADDRRSGRRAAVPGLAPTV